MSKLKNRKLQRCMEIRTVAIVHDFHTTLQLNKIYAGDSLSSDDDTKGDTCTKNAQAC